MDKTLRNYIIAGIIIITLSVVYYLIIFLPNKNKCQLDLQKQCENKIIIKNDESSGASEDYNEEKNDCSDECLNAAYDTGYSDAVTEIKKYGLEKVESGKIREP